MLDRLQKEFNIIEITDKVFNNDIETILSWLIVNKLPYNIASKMVTCNQDLYYPIVYVEKGRINATLSENLIIEYVTKMNRLLGYAS
ncbi:MAG: hypothetical protein IJ193_07565 [Bacilli bacterium]|nr:hypothetical protein [Bacilli bacterium]